MKGLIQTFRNIWKIPELKSRILFTLLLIGAYRLGSYIILPGINTGELQRMFDSTQGEGILGFIDTFVGGAFSRGSIFALGIMPYISASIIIQLMTVALPSFQKMQKEGQTGQSRLNQITRYITIAITAAQAVGYITNLNNTYPGAVVGSGPLFWLLTISILTAGTMFLLWMGEKITDKGIGNGVSLIIAIGIIADLPSALITEAQLNPIMVFYLEMIALGLATMAVVAITVAVRKIPVNYARRQTSSKMMGGMAPSVRQYIPLKLNSANVMPIIFAQAIVMLPTMFLMALDSDIANETGSALQNWKGFWFNLMFAMLIILFTYFYTSIAVNPNDIAEQLKRNGGFIPGVKPGKKTSEFIDSVLTRITLPGSIFLALIAIFPAIAANFGVSDNFAHFFGGTNLLIMIGVVLDTLQQVESYLLMRHYDGLMKSGRIKGRVGTASPVSI